MQSTERGTAMANKNSALCKLILDMRKRQRKETSEMNKDDMHNTGCFVICNFGPNEDTKDVPVYLGDFTRGITPHKFTANICKAQTFAYMWAAEEEKKRENELLAAEKHPLAGHLFIAEIFTRPIIVPKEG